MVSGTMPNDLDIYIDANDPTETGDIKLCLGTTVDISVCDSLDDGTDTWELEAGSSAGCTISTSIVCVEGAGSVYTTVPASGTAILLFTPGVDIDLSGIDKIRFYVHRRTMGYSTNVTFHAHVGENGYGGAGEQTMGNFTLAVGDTWYEKVFDISAVADADKNEINYFALNVTNNSGTKTASVRIDWLYGDPGYSSIRAFDGDRIIKLYPKIYTSHYSGSDAHQTVPIPRRGAPSYIYIIDTNSPTTLFWITGYGDFSYYYDGTGPGSGNGIHNVLDGSFDVAATYSVVGTDYYYIVAWDD